MLVGSRSDFPKKKWTARKEAVKIAEKEKIGHFEISAKTGENIELSINFFAIEILNKTFSLNMINEFYQEMKNLLESEIDIPIRQHEDNQYYDKTFFYGNEFFPFNFNNLKLNSRYFKINQNRYENESVIDISNELSLFSDEISHESIKDFILYCENDNFKLTVTNVIDLYWISIKFEVFHLISKIKNYISNNYFIIVKNFLEDKNKYNSYLIEKVIADNFINLIQAYKKQLIQLHISMLHRIISNYWDQQKAIIINDDKNFDIFKEFIISTIQYHGNKIYILFVDLGIGNNDIDFMKKLFAFSYESQTSNSIDPKSMVIVQNIITQLKEEIDMLKNGFELLKTENTFHKQIISI